MADTDKLVEQLSGLTVLEIAGLGLPIRFPLDLPSLDKEAISIHPGAS